MFNKLRGRFYSVLFNSAGVLFIVSNFSQITVLAVYFKFVRCYFPKSARWQEPRILIFPQAVFLYPFVTLFDLHSLTCRTGIR